MRKFVSKSFLLWVAAQSACMTQAAPVRLPEPLSVTTAYVLDDVFDRQSSVAPTALTTAIDDALKARNIIPQAAALSAEVLSTVRDSQGRVQQLQQSAAQNAVVLLVETQAQFYSQLSGRYRWTVSVKLTMVERGRPAKVETLDIGSLLQFDHEREAEAVASVAMPVARRVGALVDLYLAAHASGVPASPTQESPSAQKPASADSIYLVMVDRLANGDVKNDGVVDPGDPAAWHGGDIAGITQRLDYLQGLGVKTLWLTPIFETRQSNFMGHGAFHGYWVNDVTRIDERFGDEQALRDLVDACHARDMRVVLDFVVNHVAFDAPLVKERPQWFHGRGSIVDWQDPEQVLTYDVHGLPDLAQERDDVSAWLIDSAIGWIDTVGIDGFRLDAVKHVPSSFWSRFSATIRAQKGSAMLLGEYFDGASDALANAWHAGGFSHVFDFPLAFALRDVFCDGRPAGRIGAVLSDDKVYDNANALVTFLDNHDLPRIRTACGGELERVRQALTAQLAMRGVPSITYGTEAGLEGRDEPFNRGDMNFAPAPADDLRQHVTQLLRLRDQQPALAHGATRIVSYEQGVLGFARVHEGQAALVAINGGSNPAPTAFPPALTGAVTAVEAFTGEAMHKGEAMLAPGAVKIWLVEELSSRARALLTDKQGYRQIELDVSGVSLQPEERLLMVGSGQELGQWQVSGGKPMRLQLAVGELYAYKLVALNAQGDVRWEQGDNRYLFVDAGESPLNLSVAWRGAPQERG